MESVSQLLRDIHVDHVEVESLEMRGAWGAYVPEPARPTSRLVMVTEGELWVEARGRPGQATRWTAGDVGLMLPGHRFVARADPTIEPRPPETYHAQLDRDRRVVRWGTRGHLTRFTSLGCAVSPGVFAPFTEALAPVEQVVERGVSTATLRRVLEQHAAGRPGAHAALERMAEFVLVDHLSAALEARALPSVLAVDDPQIARALALVQADLGADWTSEALARRVGMSRTAFYARFTALVGQSPIRYLTRCRLEHARHLLTTTTWSLAAIARAVGYGEVAALCRAFKRTYGTTPGAARREAERGRPCERRR